MRWFTVSVLAVCVSTSTFAHHPDRENKPVHPRIDVIPPLDHWLPMSHRRKYNRPTNVGGKIMYHIAPSSQEAMAWHNATHRGYYENDRPRIVVHYFYPKPWESLPIGARPKPAADGEAIESEQPAEEVALDDPMAFPPDVPASDSEPIANNSDLIEE